jgi:tRNA threonylcarbamoyladenosine biosynthesis protein TsaE
LENIEDALEIGIEDYFDSGALCLLEWPERIEDLLPDDTVKVSIDVDPADNSRTLTIE